MRRVQSFVLLLLVTLAAAPASAAAAPASASAVAVPRPVEPFAHFVARNHAAVVALWNRNCAAWRAFQLSVKFPTVVGCDDAVRVRIASRYRITSAAQYGTGAVITYVSTGHPQGFTLAFVLGPGRRWVFDTALDPVASPGVFRGSLSAAVFDRPLRLFLAGVRAGNCDQVWAYGSWVAPNTAAGKALACRRAFGPPKAAWVRDLQANPGVRPIPFGGNRDFHFYGLRTPRHFYSVVVTNYPDAGPPSTHLTDAPFVRVF